MNSKSHNGNVVQFPRNNSARQESEKKPFRTNFARYASIEKAIEERNMIKRASERQMIGENLYRILSLFESKYGVRKAVVCEHVFGNAYYSTKRLEKYTINPDLDDSIRKSRGEKLQQKAEKYKKVVDTAATLADIADDIRRDMICMLFSGTTYDCNDTNFSDNVFDLVETLECITNGVARKADIKSYWKDIENVTGLYDHLSGTIIQSDNDFGCQVDCHASGEAFDDVSIQLPIPEVYIADTLYEETREAEIMVQKARSWVSYARVSVRMCDNISLGAMRIDGAVRPVLIIRAGVYALNVNISSVRDNNIIARCYGSDGDRVVRYRCTDMNDLIVDGTFLGSDSASSVIPSLIEHGKVVAVFNEYGRIVGYSDNIIEDEGKKYPFYIKYIDCDENNGADRYMHQWARNLPLPYWRRNDEELSPLDGEPLTSGVWYIPVNPTSVQEYFTRSGMVFIGKDSGRIDSGQLLWPLGTLGHEIEANLLYGKDKTIADLFFDDAIRKKAMLAKRISVMRDIRKNAKEKLLKKWD